jgi:hypothetical protein
LRQHDLSLANFICTFGDNQVLLDFAEEIVFPALVADTLIRKYGDTSYYIYEAKVISLGDRDGLDEIAIIGHFVKDTVLKRQQIVKSGVLVEDYNEMASAPSSFFVLLLSDHRLLYFADTRSAPDIKTFASTIQLFLRQKWRDLLKRKQDEAESKVSLKILQKQFPMPRLNVVPVARMDAITDSIGTFSKIEKIKFKLIKPNDEPDAAEVLDSVRHRYQKLKPARLDLEVADAQGLDKDESVEAVKEAASGLNTEIIVTGKDEHNNKAQADNDQFALKIPVENPPDDDVELAKRLHQEFLEQVANQSVHRAPITQKIRDAIKALASIML